MSIKNSIEEIWQVWSRLHQRWWEIKGLWIDQVQSEFEHTYWQPIENFMPNFNESAQKLDKIIQETKRNVH